MKKMRNIQILIEYDGSRYAGWQIQKNGCTVQEKLTHAIEITTNEKISLRGSGRTDAGVHAFEQSANFTTDSAIPIDKIPYALNTHLPGDIRVIEAIERELDFHSRYSSKGKIYEYHVLNNLHGSALKRNRAWHVRHSLDIEKILAGMEFLKGTHDFTSFASARSEVEDKVRTISSFDMRKEDSLLIFTLEGSGFLYNMVRIMVGTLIQTGIGKFEPEDLGKIMLEKDRRCAGITAPPQGLYLKKVLY